VGLPAQEAPLDQGGSGTRHQGQPLRDPQPGHGQAGVIGERLENRPHRHVLPAQDVAAAPAAPLKGGDVAERQVVHVDDVHGGVGESGHPPVEEVDHDLPCRSRAHVPRPERKGRQGQADVKSFGGCPEHLVLGDVLGSFVGAEQVSDIGVTGLIGRLARPRPIKAEHGDA
jgi:hypothetical protein